MVDVPAIDRSSTTERVADALRSMLFAGDLTPGEPLREVALAEAFGVSRSTVREALALLTSEGLLTRAPNRGVTVTALTEVDIAEIFEARLLLERAGISAAARGVVDLGIAQRALATYAESVRTDDHLSATRAHLDFHTSLVALLGNARLRAYAEVLTADLRLALASVERARRNARAQVADHRRLLTLARAGDEAAAVAELERHLQAARASVSERLAGG